MTEADFLTATRTFYDAIAEDYADLFRTAFATPLDRAVFAGFAELVGAGGRVADLGCGPGRVTAHLASLGLSVFGLDLSESMLAIARRENPGLRFEQGSMLELDLPDGSLAAAVSWYSSIHTPVNELPSLFAEFRRVLAPGGHLLIAFQIGDEPRRHERPWGHEVTLDFQRRRPDQIDGLLRAAGFAPVMRMVREPAPNETTQQASLIARKPT
ncbi:class I SAM-dependent methyltransferase [Streptomyces sp. GESEQ-4]|uniref:class I SAM-dependent methyltransferase n=1 Tax=Streptomyces sp. GESEQ-4 TaxID=2812655 RepID=UPI001B3189A2|nr:class I SAM-dependent methyltransferase [Streptomyces sp. GESEQ-4]